MLELRTFGGLCIGNDAASVSGAATHRKPLALLALLAAADKNGLSREKLIAFLWPGSDAAHGRSLLKQACYALRRDLRQPDLFQGATELRLNPLVVTSDVQVFQDAQRRGDPACAVQAYAGPFLDGFYLNEAGEFERWVEGERARLSRQFAEALEQLATAASAAGDPVAAAKWWRRRAEADPMSSRAALGLMTALTALGEIAAAMQYGRAYESLVRKELGTAPDAAVSELMGRLRREVAAAEGVTPDDLRLGASVTPHRRTVGYQSERAALRDALHSAAIGRGLMVCIAGEPGSGKTTLVEDFLGEVVAGGRSCHIARGHCSERLAGNGAYLPLLDALDGLLRSDVRGVVRSLMQQLAPNWYGQIAPALAPDTSRPGAPSVQAASQERLKREANAFFRELCRLRPLVVFLDDVHWVDASTIDILAYVANQMGTAQMLVVTTYRPTELLLTRHPFGPLKLDLQARGLCREMSLALLKGADIEQFLMLEFPAHRFPPTFSDFVHEKTEGNPLFVVDLVRYLCEKKVIVPDNGGWRLAQPLPNLQHELPDSVRSMIERKIERLGEGERRLLMAASVQGYEFDSAILTNALNADAIEVEERLETLGREHGFVWPLREHVFPDGTPVVRYRFVHVLYQNAFYARLTATRRAGLSRTIAEGLLSHYGDRKAEVAAELALLFETARDFPSAIVYFTLAAERAGRVFAYRERAALARRGLELLEMLPDTTERAGHELQLQLSLGFALNALDSSGNLGTGQSMMRARDLCRQLGEPPALFPAMLGLWAYYLVSSEQQAARETAERMLTVAEAVREPVWLFGAHTALGASLTHLGEHVVGLKHLQHAMDLYDPRHREAYVSLYGQDLRTYCNCEVVRTLWLVGYPERAKLQMEQMLALAREAGDPQAIAFALTFAVILHQFRREGELAQEKADALIALCDEHGIAGHRVWGGCIRGWALAEQGSVPDGIAQMREQIAALRERHMLVEVPYFLAVLAEALGLAGHLEDALACVAEAHDIAINTNQPVYMAEYSRLKGDLLAKGGGTLAEAETCLREALAIARHQQAKSLELRAATSLARLWGDDGKKGEARDLIAPIYGWFTEGLDTSDLRDARGVLDALG